MSYCIADSGMFGDGSMSTIFEHGQYKEYLRSSFSKHVVTGNLQSWSTCIHFFFMQQACGCCPNRNTNNYSSLGILLMSSTFWFSTGWAVPAFLILWFRLGRCSEIQLETVMARRRRPRLTQCTSEVMGTSEKSARSRHTGALLHSKSLTMLRISWRSACRIIPRTFSKVETCFFLWEGGWTEERGMMAVIGHWMHVDKGV